MSVTTKAMILGNGTSLVNQLRTELDDFLREAKKFSDAAWALVFQGKEKLYKFLDALTADEKHANKQVAEFRRAWRRVSASGRTLARDVRRSASRAQPRKT